ncbi:unnamed protein product, partial [Owenia fusiformis]
MDELVDCLAENTHNVWARDRIKQGWTYGVIEDQYTRRSPHLVPYNKVDPLIKKANRETANETVRTLLAYGYQLEPPTNEAGESGTSPSGLSRDLSDKKQPYRTYRGETTYAVTSGKWYYELEVITPGYMRVGYCKVSFKPGKELGEDDKSYGFDGYAAKKWHQGAESYGKQWQEGDVIGCLLDITDKTITFSLNGELMMDSMGQEIAFKDISITEGYVPAFTLGAKQLGKLNFGQDVNTLKYFTCCGLQEGYEPFCVNMTRQMTLWYGKDQAIYEPMSKAHPRLDVQRIQGGSGSPPCLKVNSKNFGTLEKVRLEFLRLSMPVICQDQFTHIKKGSAADVERRLNLENIHRRQEEEEHFNQATNSEGGNKIIAGGAEYDPTDTDEEVEMLSSSSPLRENASNRVHVLSLSSPTDSMKRPPTCNSIESAATLQNGDAPVPILKNKKHALRRGLTDDRTDGSDRRSRKLHKQSESFDETAARDEGLSNGRLKRGSSETRLDVPAEGLGKQGRSGSKSSIMDKFSDISKKLNDHKDHKDKDAPKEKKERGKSPFSLFKKSKSRDTSPSSSFRNRSMDRQRLDIKPPSKWKTSSYRGDEKTSEFDEAPAINVHAPAVPPEFDLGPNAQPFIRPNASFGSLNDFESDADASELQALADIIDEYYYGVRIFPGQDPAHVYVGWVTPGFHMFSKEFDMKGIRNVIVCQLDVNYKMKSSFSRKNCYMVSAGDLQHRYGSQEATSSRRGSPGLLIGCHVDTSTGALSFTLNGKEVANKFAVEPGTMLFPAVFCEPTSKEVMQFELGRTKDTLPLSSVLFRGTKYALPQCPPRLDVQVLKQSQWSRVPNQALKVHTLKLSEIRGYSMLCEDPVPMMAIHIPEEDRCLDMLELIEHEHILKFHKKTLDLYQAVCSHGNHKMAHELIKHVDEKQLMYCILNEYVSGPLRMGFHNLLITLHLDTHAHLMEMTVNEYIIPLAFDPKSLKLCNRPNENDDALTRMRKSIPPLDVGVSIRPKLQIEKEAADRFKVTSEYKDLTSPYFPLDRLKHYIMHLLTQAVQKGAEHIRDPIGGSNENLFVPLLKVCDNLLVMGLLDDKDLMDLLKIIDPQSFDDSFKASGVKGLIHMKLAEPVQLELCFLLQHLCDSFLRHRIEAIVAFSDEFVTECQNDQLKRYHEIKQTDFPPAVMARKTREFRCPPQEQMRSLLSFRSENEEEANMCSCRPDLRDLLSNFHLDLLNTCRLKQIDEEGESGKEKEVEEKEVSWGEKLMTLVASKKTELSVEAPTNEQPDSIQKLIAATVVRWAKTDFIASQALVREMFSLLHRQYDGLGEVCRALEKTYVISSASTEDINNLLRALGITRALLNVQVGGEEEELLKTSLWELMDNKVFFQHPDLMRALGMHKTVQKLMVNTLNRSSQQKNQSAPHEDSISQRRNSSTGIAVVPPEDTAISDSADMVVMCSRFLCYFCRTGSHNQRAMFEHLSYLLDNSSMLLSRPSLRGSCPLDVAYSSLMDNNELALALRESHLEKVAIYLARCGIQSNAELVAKGYPDIGWDPVEGERFLDFFRFCVWVNGESVEENASLVVRLLIRRPESLGPALRGEGGGLLKAMKDGIKMSEQIAASKGDENSGFLQAVADEDEDGAQYLLQSKWDFSTLPPDDDEDYIDMGGAILTFYSVLVDLLGRCAPGEEAIKAGRSDSLRARAILRSLVSMEDLEGVLGLRFILPVSSPQQQVEEAENEATKEDLPPGLLPIHKAAIVLFLERVYGIEDQLTFFRLLENCFLPDLRAATTLDTAAASESDMALALNRYLCNSVLPLLTTHNFYFDDADHASTLLDSTLHTVYRLSKCRSLTKGQRDTVSDFLVALTSQLRPPMMTRLLRKLTVDVPALNENTVVPLRVLTHHYERCGRYYGSLGGFGGHGSATEEEKRLTMMLFSSIFDSLAQITYDPELFAKALPCLSAIGCALSPDYSLTNQDEQWYQQISDTDGVYNPNPIETS